jgi:hypothetical protein
MKNSVYYLPGHGGRIATGLGDGLLRRGFDVAGRETVGDFKTLSFTEQVETIGEDLTNMFWSEDAQIIANSYGAYLFLHAQSQMQPFIGRVLLLSPIIGEFSDDENSGLGFVPPYAGKIANLVERGTYPNPRSCEAHVGTLDWQSNPVNVSRLLVRVGINVTVVEGRGHDLGTDYVSKVLDRWLSKSEVSLSDIS